MRKIIAVFLASFLCSVFGYAGERVRVRGYTKKDGTYVAPYERSRPNAFRWDNTNYLPTQDPYNDSYKAPTKNYSPQWYQPNADRFLDSNPNNDYPPLGYVKPARYKSRDIDIRPDVSGFDEAYRSELQAVRDTPDPLDSFTQALINGARAAERKKQRVEAEQFQVWQEQDKMASARAIKELRESPGFNDGIEQSMISLMAERGLTNDTEQGRQAIAKYGRVRILKAAYESVTGRKWGEW